MRGIRRIHQSKTIERTLARIKLGIPQDHLQAVEHLSLRANDNILTDNKL